MGKPVVFLVSMTIALVIGTVYSTSYFDSAMNTLSDTGNSLKKKAENPEETYKDAKHSVGKGLDKAKDTYNDAKKTVESKTKEITGDKVKAQVSDAAQTLKEKSNEVPGKAKAAYEDVTGEAMGAAKTTLDTLTPSASPSTFKVSKIEADPSKMGAAPEVDSGDGDAADSENDQKESWTDWVKGMV